MGVHDPHRECSRYQAALNSRVTEDHASSDLAEATLHARSCRECRLFATALEALEDLAREPVHDAALVTRRALSQLKREHRTPIPRRRKLQFALAVSLVAALGGVLWMSSTGLHLDIVDGALYAGARVPVAKLEKGTRFEAGDRGAVLNARGRARFHFLAGSRGTVRRAESRELSLQLKHGRVASQIVPGSNAVSIHTDLCRITVTGTAFLVEAREDQVSVDVIRGAVDVDTPSSAAKSLRAGQSLSLPGNVVEPLDPTRRAAFHDMISGRLALEVEPKPPVTPSEGHHQPAKKRQGRRAKTRPAATDVVDDLLARASACRGQKDWDCAAAAYRTVVKRHGERPEAVTAIVALADIELHKQNTPKAALAHFKLYLARRPEGALVPEALFGKAECLRVLERGDEERAVLRTLLEHHPLSMYSQRAKKRLREMSR